MNLVDKDGQFVIIAVPIAVVAIAAVVIWTGTCAQQAELAGYAYSPHDKQRHCYANCYFNKCMGNGAPLLALGGSFVYELWNWAEGHRPLGWSAIMAHMKAAIYGIIKSYSFSTCDDACKTCPDYPER